MCEEFDVFLCTIKHSYYYSCSIQDDMPLNFFCLFFFLFPMSYKSCKWKRPHNAERSQNKEHLHGFTDQHKRLAREKKKRRANPSSLLSTANYSSSIDSRQRHDKLTTLVLRLSAPIFRSAACFSFSSHSYNKKSEQVANTVPKGDLIIIILLFQK